MACNIETFAYPAWWPAASTVQISYTGGNSGSVNRADVEFLPQGISWAAGVLIPWPHVADVQKLT
ncbi:hypothetical protein [Streptomyces sp. NPDC058394]|uniref:hypothetical protein n=1 Tax=Streptomyces sp. NPDC058394 TaxID=3346477 RepID=UPI0036598E9E